ncbi:MAG: TIGR01777 family protein [Elusimicrobia bacterium]|nr:TIGR01777 family protein [Elusimicrobiota bacterium]
MKILIAGGTGFVGRELCRALGAAGHELVVVSRREGRPPEGAARRLAWGGAWPRELEGAGAVVNLAGAGVADRRWSAARKAAIRESRLQATRRLVEALARARAKPEVLVNASAVGCYGDRGEELLTEASAPGEGFLARVCLDWEAEAARAREAGVRVVLARLGVVLGPGGGALARMLLPFKLGLGGPLGSGRQFMSWIHIADAAGLLAFAARRRTLEGPLNAVAPGAVRNAEFVRELAAALHRPCLLPAPAFALRLALGELAGMLLGGQRVEPAKAAAHGYVFRFPALMEALADVLR